MAQYNVLVQTCAVQYGDSWLHVALEQWGCDSSEWRGVVSYVTHAGFQTKYEKRNVNYLTNNFLY